MQRNTIGTRSVTASFVFFAFSLLGPTYKIVGAGYQGISVSINPPLSQTWSGNATIIITVNGDPTNGGTEAGNNFNGMIDGGVVIPLGCFRSSNALANCTFDTTKLSNGSHTLFVSVAGTTTGAVAGTYGPFSFNTNNGHLPWQLRSNYNELWLTVGQNVQLAAKLIYTDKTEAVVSGTGTVFSAAPATDPNTGVQTTVVTVDTNGNVVAQAIGDTTINIIASGLTQTTSVHVNDINVTPHFGYDGSLLTSYVPGKSMFVSSMFFLAPTTDAATIAQYKAAGLNTFEGGFVPYDGPVTGGETAAQWIAAETQNYFQPYKAALDASGMSIMLTGDDVAGSPTNLYNVSRGPGAQMTPSALTSAMSLAAGLGRTIGVEMVDEVSYRYGYNPYPKGQLGAAGGPQQITCVSDVCTVNWPISGYQRYSLMLGNRFIITGATSNSNLNRPSSNIYSAYNGTPTSFQFNTTGVGTQTFTPQTDPNLVIQAFAYGPEGPSGTDYVHNDAISVLMDQIHAAGTHPPITWPVAGNTPNAVRLWQGDSQFADFNNIYFPGWGGLPDTLAVLNKYFGLNYPQEQRDRPTIIESLGTTAQPYFVLRPSPVPITTINNDTVVFAQPHGVTQQDLNAGHPRFSVTGNSNSALNSNYDVYAIPDAYTVKVFRASSASPSSAADSGMKAQFSSGNIYQVNLVNVDSGTAFAGPGQSYAFALLNQTANGCIDVSNTVGQTLTLSDPGNSLFDNTRYYVVSYRGIYYTGSCTLLIANLPTGAGSGGSAAMIYSNYPGRDPNEDGQTPMVIADNIVWAAAKGGAGVRSYHYTNDLNSIGNDQFPSGGVYVVSDLGINPQYNGPDSIAGWNAMSNANNLIHSIEPFLLQPKMQSPDYGPYMVTAARTSSYGKLLLMANFTDAPDTETIDLSPYNPLGGTGTMYRMTATSLTNSPISGTSTQVTFGPGETVAFTFQTCPYNLSANALNVTSSGGFGTITASVAIGCSAPTAGSNVAWASVSVVGNSVNWTITANPSSLGRNGALTIAGQTIIITQAGLPCSYNLNPSSVSVGSAGGAGNITVTQSPLDCSVAPASSGVSWASVSVSGNIASWFVSANPSSLARSGNFTIGGKSASVSQSGAGTAASGTLTLNRTVLNFGTSGSLVTSAQTVVVGFAGGSGVAWTVSSSQPNITVAPWGGTGAGSFTVTAVAGASGTVTVTAPGAASSPQQVQINVSAVTPGSPTGSFDTPVSGTSGIAGAIPVTGWALDNIEVTRVDIWREPVASEPPGLAYIGDAVFVADARTDIESSFRTSPFQYRGGWGYMLLTNFLPNNGGSPGPGNGTFALHAIAHNAAGHSLDLGTRTITVDNAHASKPFGTIDTPGPGATISGNAYVNFGWALTQNPYNIPTNASTLTVIVDGQTIGHPTYNQYRADIANFFPGLANTNGAIGFFYIDTTTLANGVHTISWNVYDNQSRGDGIGSRYFTVQNNGAIAASNEDPVVVPSGEHGEVADVEMEELDRIELGLGAARGYLLVNGERRPLPIGSSMKRGVFYWLTGPGFLGEYQLAFERPGSPDLIVRVTIRPKRFP